MKVIVISNLTNTAVYLGEFKNKAQAKAYWANGDKTLIKIIKSGQEVKFLSEEQARKEIINIIKSRVTGAWETQRVISLLNVIKRL